MLERPIVEAATVGLCGGVMEGSGTRAVVSPFSADFMPLLSFTFTPKQTPLWMSAWDSLPPLLSPHPSTLLPLPSPLFYPPLVLSLLLFPCSFDFFLILSLCHWGSGVFGLFLALNPRLLLPPLLPPHPGGFCPRGTQIWFPLLLSSGALVPFLRTVVDV